MRTIRTARDLGIAIRRARHDRKWSQTELARRAAVSRQWLSEVETGKRTVELGRVLTLLDALDLALTVTDSPTDSGAVDLDDLLRSST